MTQARIAAASVVVAVGICTAVLAQGRARVWGLISDEAGAPLPGVTISVIDPDGGKVKAQTESNKKGRYTVALLDATKPYLFRFERDGFKTIEEEMKVSILSNTRRDFTMNAGRGVAKSSGPATGSSGGASGQYNAGVAEFENGNLEAAKERFLAAIERDADFGLAHSALARAHFRLEEWSAARDRALAALELDDEDEVALSVLYQSYERLGDEDEAKAIYTRLEGLLEPAVAAYNVGAEAFTAERFEEAMSQFAKALEHDPELAPAHAAVARLHARDEEWSEAAAAAERALELGDTNTATLQVRYEAYRALGDEARTREAFEALKTAAPEQLVGDYYQQAVDLFNANQIEEAKTFFARALELDPDHARSHYMMGLSGVNTGDNASAKEHFERFLELSPDDPDAATAREMIKYLE